MEASNKRREVLERWEAVLRKHVLLLTRLMDRESERLEALELALSGAAVVVPADRAVQARQSRGGAP
jgi:hypothetical protein